MGVEYELLSTALACIRAARRNLQDRRMKEKSVTFCDGYRLALLGVLIDQLYEMVPPDLGGRE